MAWTDKTKAEIAAAKGETTGGETNVNPNQGGGDNPGGGGDDEPGEDED